MIFFKCWLTFMHNLCQQYILFSSLFFVSNHYNCNLSSYLNRKKVNIVERKCKLNSRIANIYVTMTAKQGSFTLNILLMPCPSIGPKTILVSPICFERIQFVLVGPNHFGQVQSVLNQFLCLPILDRSKSLQDPSKMVWTRTNQNELDPSKTNLTDKFVLDPQNRRTRQEFISCIIIKEMMIHIGICDKITSTFECSTSHSDKRFICRFKIKTRIGPTL